MSERDLDRDQEYERDVFADDVRPFFGEESATVGLPLPPRQPQQRRGTIDELRQWRVEQGRCPRVACVGDLDESLACPVCGWSQTEELMRARLARKEHVENHDDYIETLPGALTLGIEDAK